MKTVFITSFHPLISRNILRTGLLDILSDRGIRTVILVPQIKREYFSREFSGKDIFVEGVDTKLSGRDIFFRQLALALTPTADMRIKRRTKLREDKNIFSFILAELPHYIFSGNKTALSFFRFCDRMTQRGDFADELFAKYSPDLVFSADAQNELDVRLLHSAERKNVRTAAMIRSWDNLTSKGILRVVPDILITHNDTVKDEAAAYSRVPAERISVIGIPHYDRYLKKPAESKEMFFKKFGFDAAKKLILFAPIGDRYIRNNGIDKYVLRVLSGLDANILVRIPPTDKVSFDGFKSGKAKTVFYDSGTSSWKGGKKINEIGPADEEELVASLTYADVVVTGQSTIVIDAAVFGKPAVVVRFTPDHRTYWDGISKYYDYEYYDKFSRYCGLRFAGSEKELSELVAGYLRMPGQDADIRRRIVENQVCFTDGKSTSRLADLLLNWLKQ